MKFRSFRHNFHDGHLANFTLGPRRELTLEIALDPVWNKEAPSSAFVRFGGIGNFDEVAAFFRALPEPRQADESIAEVISLHYAEDEKGCAVLDLDGFA